MTSDKSRLQSSRCSDHVDTMLIEKPGRYDVEVATVQRAFVVSTLLGASAALLVTITMPLAIGRLDAALEAMVVESRAFKTVVDTFDSQFALLTETPEEKRQRLVRQVNFLDKLARRESPVSSHVYVTIIFTGSFKGRKRLEGLVSIDGSVGGPVAVVASSDSSSAAAASSASHQETQEDWSMQEIDNEATTPPPPQLETPNEPPSSIQIDGSVERSREEWSEGSPPAPIELSNDEIVDFALDTTPMPTLETISDDDLIETTTEASTILRLAAPERRYSPPRRREPSAEHRALLAQLHALAVAGVPFERRVRPLDQTVDNDESPKQSKRKQMAMGLDIRCPRGVRGEKGSRGIDAPNGAVGEPGRAGVSANGLGVAQSVGVSQQQRQKTCIKIQCQAGARGPRGRKGVKGPRGVEGPPGEPAVPSLDGLPGPKGEVGTFGNEGESGWPGVDGEPGADVVVFVGSPGAQGERGVRGDPGPKGSVGEDGFKGLSGARGPRGRPGVQGRPGERGRPGPEGEFGDDANITYCECPIRVTNSESKEAATPAQGTAYYPYRFVF